MGACIAALVAARPAVHAMWDAGRRGQTALPRAGQAWRVTLPCAGLPVRPSIAGSSPAMTKKDFKSSGYVIAGLDPAIPGRVELPAAEAAHRYRRAFFRLPCDVRLANYASPMTSRTPIPRIALPVIAALLALSQSILGQTALGRFIRARLQAKLMQMLMDGFTELFRQIAESKRTPSTQATEPPTPSPAAESASTGRPAAESPSAGRPSAGRPPSPRPKPPSDPPERASPTGRDPPRPPDANQRQAKARGTNPQPLPPLPPNPPPRPSAERQAAPHRARSPPRKKSAAAKGSRARPNRSVLTTKRGQFVGWASAHHFLRPPLGGTQLMVG